MCGSTRIYTLSLHDALPISRGSHLRRAANLRPRPGSIRARYSSTLSTSGSRLRSEEHTSELQSHSDLVCRLLLEKKKGSAGGHSRLERSPPRWDFLTQLFPY